MSELTYRDIDHVLSEHDRIADTLLLPSDTEATGLVHPPATGFEINEAARDDSALRDRRTVENVTLTGSELQGDDGTAELPVQRPLDLRPACTENRTARGERAGAQVLRITAREQSAQGDNTITLQGDDTAETDTVPNETRQVVATEFRRIIVQHGHDVDSDTRHIFDLTLSGRDAPDAIRMRTFRSSADGQHIVMGPQPSASEAGKFASVAGVMVAGSGSTNVDRLERYRGLSDEQILSKMGEEPDRDTLATLARALSICEVPERPRRISLPTEEERIASNRDRAVRVRLINDGVSEAAGKQRTAPVKAGPYHDDFTGILGTINQRLARINAASGLSLTPESIVPASYQSKETKREVEELSRFRDGRRALAEVAWARRQLLRELVSDYIDMSDQSIREDLLTEPAYLPMSYDQKACFNACFRMILGDVTGQTLTESEVSNALQKVHGESLVADDEYIKILESNAVEESSGHTVKAVEFFGADLEYVAKLASIVKDKRPDAKIFGVVSLGTESGGDSDIWHTNILLGADTDYVYCHDPSKTSYGAPNRQIKKEEFISRWATAYNRGYVVFALPKNRQDKAAA